MAKYFREIFGDKLCADFDPNLKELPSPNALRNKILIKVSVLGD